MTKNVLYPCMIPMIEYILAGYYTLSLCQLIISKEVISKIESGKYTSNEIELIYVGYTEKLVKTTIQYADIETINIRIGSLNSIIDKTNDEITNRYQQKKKIKEIDSFYLEDIYKKSCGYNEVIDEKLSTISNLVDELESSISKIENDIFSDVACDNLPDVVDEINALIDKLSKQLSKPKVNDIMSYMIDYEEDI